MEDLLSGEEESRRLRKKKRRRSRLIAWIAFILILAGLGTGVFFFFKNTDIKLDILKPAASVSKEETSVSVSVSVSSEIPEPSKEQEIITDVNTGEEEITVDPSELEPKPPTEEELFLQAVEAYVAALPIEDKVAGLFIVSPEQITGVQIATLAGEGTRKALEQYAVGGIVYSDKNITGAANFKEMLTKTREMARIPLFLAISEETGNGVLAGKLKLAETMKASDIGATGDTQTAYEQASIIASYLKEYGIDLNLGLCADVLTDPENGEMAGHCFGTDADICAGMTGMMAKAYWQWGVNVALKSFPGEGSAASSTANGLVTVERTLDQARECEFKSFLSGISEGAQMILVSHEFAPAITGDNEQCSRSRTLLTDIIRLEFGLDDTIIITDALSKTAISAYYDSAEATVASVKAGADMILLPEDFKEAYDGLIEAVNAGIVSTDRIDASLERIFKVKFRGLSAEEIQRMTPSVNTPSENDASGNDAP